MAVFRIERTLDYTVMSNHHLKDTALSLKAKGLLSMMLSLPDEWNYTTRGLAAICKEGVDAIGGALRELEKAGYIVRRQLRGPGGRISDTEYTIYEKPCPGAEEPPEEPGPDTTPPDTGAPDTAFPYLVEPDMGAVYSIRQGYNRTGQPRRGQDHLCLAPCRRLHHREDAAEHEAPTAFQCDLSDSGGRFGRYGQAPANGSRRRP